MKNVNILIVGTGMYVCGRGTDSYGTIMPAVCEWKKVGIPGEVYISGTGPESIKLAKRKIDKLKKKMNVDFSIKYLLGIREVPKPACAIIAVPDRLHERIASNTIKKGLHTLVVKPLAPTLKEVQKLIEMQKKHNLYCAVEFHKRFDLANIKLRDVISKGAIGDPLYFVVEYSQRKNIPERVFRKWVKTTNVFQYLGVHYVDIIYFVTKAIPTRAMAIGQKGWLASQKIDIHDSIQATIEWSMPSGKKFTSHIMTNWIDPENTSAMSDQRIKVVGTEGRFESDQKKRGITIVTDKSGMEEPNPYFCSAFGSVGSISYSGYGIESICKFLDDATQIENGKLKVRNLEDKRPTFRNSLVPTAVLEAVNKSLRKNGAWIAVEKVDNGAIRGGGK